MQEDIKSASKQTIQVQTGTKQRIQNDPQYKPLLNLLSVHKVSKICQKLIIISLNLSLQPDRKIFLQSLISLFNQQYLPLFSDIDSKNRLRTQILETLLTLSKEKESMSKQFINKAYIKLEQYRLSNLEYIQGLLKLCKVLSHQSLKYYENLMKKCSRIFIKLHTTTLNTHILPHLFQFSTNFDPLMIDLKGTNEYCNFKLKQKFTKQPELKTRLTTIHQEILKFIDENQIKLTQENLFLHNIISDTNPDSKFYNEVNKTKNINFFQDNQIMQMKSSFKIKIRQNRRSNQSVDEPKNSKEISSEQIVKNFRKKSLQHRLNTSVESKEEQPSSLQRATISTENYHELHQKAIKNNERYMKVSKRLNFRAINLQPLENINPTTSLSSGNIVPLDGGQNPKVQNENKGIFNLKRKNHRNQTEHYSQADKSLQGQTKEFSDFDSLQKGQKSTKKMSLSLSNKLPYALPKRTFRRFESDDDPSSGISDESSAQISRSEFNRFKRRQKTKPRSDRIIDENQILKYRKRRISEIEEQENKDLSRNNTSQVEDLEKEITNLGTHHKKEDEQMGELTTNIESKGEELQESEYIEYVRRKPEQNDKKFEIALQRQLVTNPQNEPPLPAIPASSFTQKQHQTSFIETGQSHDTSLLKIQEPKQDLTTNQNKVKRKIILKASKAQFEDIYKYLQNLGYLSYDTLLKQISVHQHYICEFYLNETLFNILVFCPSLDFKHVEIKLIHQVECSQKELFESVSVKEKFRKVVLKNFIQIIEKSASLIFSSVIIKNPTSDQLWISECGFSSIQNSLAYKLHSSNNRQKTRQFLTINGSIFSIEQKVSETFLYSDQISPFKSGKYDINDSIFNGEDFELMPSYSCKGLRSLREVNEILQLKELDTFQVNSSLEELIFQPKEGSQHEANLKTFTLEQILNQKFIISNGWIKTTSSLIFDEKNKRIAEILLPGNYQMHFGKGFQHIGTMKNKIIHYKTRKNSTKPQQPLKQLPTKIRMFSKQLYGLIKHQDDQAHYGNWEMNFHFKHQFLGRVVYSIETQSNQNRLIFGNSTFFVTIYQGDQFVIGWEVEENDFLY